MVPATAFLLLGVLPLATLAADQRSVTNDLGPALWGDPKYYVRLKNLMFSEGKLDPPFDKDGSEFTLKINNPQIRSFTMTVQLALAKYNLQMTPKVEVDWKEIEYSPLNTIDKEIMVNETCGEEDKWVTVTISDPKGAAGGLFGHPAKAHDYKIHVLQAPEYDKVVMASKVAVQTQDGIPLDPLEDDGNVTGTYTYVIPEDQYAATLQAWCSKFSTRMVLNGEAAEGGEALQVQMVSPTVTTLVECIYENALWSDNIVERTYQVKFVRAGVAHTLPKLRMMPEVGYCELEDGEEPKIASYSCSSAKDFGILVAEYDSGSETLFLDNLDTQKSVNILRGLPTTVHEDAEVNNYQIRVIAGDDIIQVPMKLYKGQQCAKFECPPGWVPKAKLDAGEDAERHTCKTNHCNMADDGDRCCREAGEPCQEWHAKWECKTGELFPYGFCKDKPCRESDEEYCCLDEDAVGQYGPADGSAEKKVWEKAYKNAMQHESQYAPKVMESMTLTGISMSDFASSEEAKLAMESALAKLVGTTPDTVKVEMTGAAPVSVAITITSEEGVAKSKELYTAMHRLSSDQVAREAILELGALGIEEPKLKVDELKKAKLSVPDSPEMKTTIQMQAPPSLKADAPEEDGSKSELVEEALTVAFKSQLDLNSGEETYLLTLSASDAPGPGIAEGMTPVQAALKLKMDAGDLGGLDIVNAKLSTIDVAEINVIMQEELIKGGLSEEDAVMVKVLSVAGAVMNKGAATGAVNHSPEYILGVWLKQERTTSQQPVVEMMQIDTNNGKCLHSASNSVMGAPVTLKTCDTTSEKQQWTFTVPRGQIRNTFGMCLAADLNGPPGSPHWTTDTSADVLQSWIFQRGPGRVNMWMCNDHWQQQWNFDASTGLIKLSLSSNPGICVQVANPEGDDSYLETALCDTDKFAQQFWNSEAPLKDWLPSGNVPAQELPHFVKPFFEGEVAKKLPSGEYNFELAPFAKKRAAFYLTQGCSPVPTKSCGAPMPDMPGVYIGQSLLKMDEKVDEVPWHIAISGATSSSNAGSTTCFYDPSCTKDKTDGGCMAGGKETCRYCGFDNFTACPENFDCADGGLHQGLWAEEKQNWCCKHFSIGCKPPHDCLKDIETWKTSWEPAKQSWCCQYQNVGCPYECKTDFSVWDPSVWDQDHAFWCSIFGKGDKAKTQSNTPNEFERLIMKKNEKDVTVVADERLQALIHPSIAFAVAAGICGLLLAGVLQVRRASLMPSSSRGLAERSLVMAGPAEAEAMEAFLEESTA